METRSQKRKRLSHDEVNPNLALLTLRAPCNPAKESQPRRINRSTSQAERGRPKKKNVKTVISTPPNDYEENTLLKCSELLFEEFERKIQHFLKFGAYENPNLNCYLVLLARNCILVLRLLESNRDALFEKWKILSRVLRQIYCFARANRSGPHPPSTPIIAVLEVFIKEFMERPDTKYYLVAGNNATTRGKNLLDASAGNSSLIQELISIHFLLSFPKQMYRTFAKAVSGNASTSCSDKQILELGLGFGLDSTLALLGTSLSSSSPMPYFLQAHLSMLSTRYIDTLNLVQDSDSGTLDRAVSAFELSSRIYWQSLCDMGSCNGITIVGTKSKLKSRSFTCKALDCHVENLVSFCNSESKEISQKDLSSTLFSYIEENKCIVHEDFRNQTSSLLERMISRSLSHDDEESSINQLVGCNISDEMISLSASLRLMGSSILQVVSESRKMNGGVTTISNEKGKKRVSRVIRNFASNEADEIVRRIFLDVVGAEEPKTSKRSQVMLRHFGNLLMFGLKTKIGFLLKACIFAIMSVMDLVAFEEENLDLCRLVFDGVAKEKELLVTTTPTKQARNVTVGSSSKRKSSVKIAKEFLKVKRLCYGEKSEMKTRNGRAYLESLPEYQKDPQEWEDLEDFIECKEGKDYSAWLEIKDTLRERKYAKRGKKEKNKSDWIEKDLRVFGSIERNSNKKTRSRARIL